MTRNALPPRIQQWIEDDIGPVSVVTTVGGGCVTPALRVRLPDGDAFLKYDEQAASGLFTAEADGLDALRDAGSLLRVPEVLGAWSDDGISEGPACLLLEWLDPAPAVHDFGERLGRGLAELHRSTGGWGWRRDGFIGPLPQANTTTDTWAGFWRTRRLEPQLELARRTGRRVGAERDWATLWERLPDLLAAAEVDGPSLVHGDLWSGNVLAAVGANSGQGEPALVDPAAYRGHREVDLAMAELFGGFGQPFFAAYRESWPLQPTYAPGRRAAYQLYYLLVHVNLFGGGYVAGAEGALRQALDSA